jgi:putative DNA primase/helicase
MPQDDNSGSPQSPPKVVTLVPSGARDAIHKDFVAANGSWRDGLARNDKQQLLPVVENVVAILLNDERWSGVIAYDEFGGRVMKLKPPPFDRAEGGEWMDIDDARLELWLGQTYALRRVSAEAISKGVLLAADANRYHEVRRYLDALVWDDTPRLDGLLWAYLGATRSDYAEAVARKWMIGAVARVYRPGCKMDNVLILEGTQGAGKSSALKILFQPWFTDAAFEIGSTDGYQIIRGMWCVELAELDGFNRAEASRSKAFFTRTEDRYRNPYGRKPVNVPRQGVFAGSVNHATYLKDDSGNRRYWPVTIGLIGLDDLAADRDQLWAEAVHRYKAGDEWWVRAAERELYEGEQDARYIGDAYESRIRDWLDEPDVSGVRPEQVTVAKIMQGALKLDIGKWTLAEQQRVGRIMARVGWPRRRLPGGSREWVYCRPEDAQ